MEAMSSKQTFTINFNGGKEERSSLLLREKGSRLAVKQAGSEAALAGDFGALTGEQSHQHPVTLSENASHRKTHFQTHNKAGTMRGKQKYGGS